MNTAEMTQQLWDKQTITERIYKYARALDRMDAQLMKDSYWEDGTEEHQDPIFPEQFFYDGNGHTFVPIAMKGFESLKLTQHRISNVLIELDGNKAAAEAYVWAYHVHTDEEGVDHEGILYGRHLFKMGKRDNEWKIEHRSTIFDSNANQKASAVWSDKFANKYKGFRNETDDSYNYLKQ